MIISLEDYINHESINKILDNFNKLEEGEKLTIYLNTDGGDLDNQELLLDVINNHKDKIILIANGEICSAGFNTFFRANCERRITIRTIGMAHYTYSKIETNASGKPSSDYEKFHLKQLKKEKNVFISFLKELGLTNSELNIVKKGNDAYFTYERLQELLRNSNAKNNKEE